MSAIKPFNSQALLALADEALAAPPARPHIIRPVPLGVRIARFALPLELCKPMNRIARRGTQAAGWALGAMKEQAFHIMRRQQSPRSAPLPGRPQVLCIRFSSSEPDKYADWQKNPVDRLRVNAPTAKKRLGLGFIVDDKPSCIDLQAWWELARPKQGFVGCPADEACSVWGPAFATLLPAVPRLFDSLRLAECREFVDRSAAQEFAAGDAGARVLG